MKRIMLVCLTALAVSGTYPLYAQSSGSDFMAGDKSLFEEVTGIKKKTDKFIRGEKRNVSICGGPEND